MPTTTTRTAVEDTGRTIAVAALAALAGYTIVASGTITVPVLGAVPVSTVGVALLVVSLAVFVRQKRAASGGECDCC